MVQFPELEHQTSMAEDLILGYLQTHDEITDSVLFANDHGLDRNEVVDVIKTLHDFRYIDAQLLPLQIPNPEMAKTCQKMRDLPSALLVDVLSRLPAKDLGRLKCVCKRWANLINSRDLIKRHLKRSTSSRNRSLVVYRNNSLFSCNLETKRGTAVHFPLKPNSDIDIIGSCDGLLCFMLNDDIIILNVTTKEYRKLPKWPTVSKRLFPKSEYFTVYGFGRDYLRDDYKVVRILQYVRRDYVARILKFLTLSNLDSDVQVYSLRDNSWSTVAYCPHSLLENDISGVHVKGALHWVAKRGSGCYVIAFDLCTGNYTEVALPDYPDHGATIRLTVAGLEGKLCLVFNYLGICDDLWVMDEYGIHSSWYQLVSLAKPQLGFYVGTVEPLAMSESNSRIFLSEYWGDFGWYDMEKKKFKEVLFGDAQYEKNFVWNICLSSLVKLDDQGYSQVPKRKKQKKNKNRRKNKSKRDCGEAAELKHEASTVEDSILGHDELKDSGIAATEDGLHQNELHDFRCINAQDMTWLLTDEGKKYAAEGTPEVQLFLAVPADGSVSKDELQKKLDPEVFKIGCSRAGKNDWVEIGKQVSRKVQHVEDKIKDLLLKIQDGEALGEDDINALKARELIVPQTWKGYKVRKGPDYAPKRKQVGTDLTLENLQSLNGMDKSDDATEVLSSKQTPPDSEAHGLQQSTIPKKTDIDIVMAIVHTIPGIVEGDDFWIKAAAYLVASETARNFMMIESIGLDAKSKWLKFQVNAMFNKQP